MNGSTVKLIECPRDAMQGWRDWIPTDKKIAYLEALLQVGFDTIDGGSFVSPKAIPQMADTAAVLSGIDPATKKSRLLVIVANVRGAEAALQFPVIDMLGYPLSVSETFQQKNTHSTIADSLRRINEIHAACRQAGKQLVVYLSMAFGNPYGDPYDATIVYELATRLATSGIGIISLADTVGLATPEQVSLVTKQVVGALPGVEIGVHLHSSSTGRAAKIGSAYEAGCRRFDGALLGMGGCPMANDQLIGNIDTEWMVAYFEHLGVLPPLNAQAWSHAMALARQLFQ